MRRIRFPFTFPTMCDKIYYAGSEGRTYRRDVYAG